MEKFCSPNLVTCNIMLNAYIKHGMFEEAKELFNKILEDRDYISCKDYYKTRVLPDTYTFNTMLDACFEGKMWDDLEFVFQKMLDHGYHFNVDRHLHCAGIIERWKDWAIGSNLELLRPCRSDSVTSAPEGALLHKDGESQLCCSPLFLLQRSRKQQAWVLKVSVVPSPKRWCVFCPLVSTFEVCCERYTNEHERNTVSVGS